MIVLGGRRLEVPGVTTVSFLDDARRVPRATRGTPRRGPVQFVVLHTTGERTEQNITPGAGTLGANPWHFGSYVNTNSAGVSWDATVLVDGKVLWHNDPVERATYHASWLNGRGLGIEVQQGTGGAIYQVQVDALVKLVDVITAAMGIQRQIPWKEGRPDRRVLARLSREAAGADVWGVVGHRNGDDNRGDPGDGIHRAFHAAGYEGFDLALGADKEEWRARQAELGIAATGVPSLETGRALSARGKVAGMWVARPSDRAVPQGGSGPVGGDAGGGGGGGKAAAAVLGAAVLGALAWSSTRG